MGRLIGLVGVGVAEGNLSIGPNMCSELSEYSRTTHLPNLFTTYHQKYYESSLLLNVGVWL